MRGLHYINSYRHSKYKKESFNKLMLVNNTTWRKLPKSLDKTQTTETQTRKNRKGRLLSIKENESKITSSHKEIFTLRRFPTQIF